MSPFLLCVYTPLKARAEANLGALMREPRLFTYGICTAGYSSVYSLMLVDSSEQLELMASKSEVRVVNRNNQPCTNTSGLVDIHLWAAVAGTQWSGNPNLNCAHVPNVANLLIQAWYTSVCCFWMCVPNVVAEQVVMGRDLEFSGVPSTARNPAEDTVHSVSSTAGGIGRCRGGDGGGEEAVALCRWQTFRDHHPRRPWVDWVLGWEERKRGGECAVCVLTPRNRRVAVALCRIVSWPCVSLRTATCTQSGHIVNMTHFYLALHVLPVSS